MFYLCEFDEKTAEPDKIAEIFRRRSARGQRSLHFAQDDN
jgi:hypothetical protein